MAWPVGVNRGSSLGRSADTSRHMSTDRLRWLTRLLVCLSAADWRLVQLTFRLQGNAVEQSSTLHFTNSIGEAEPLVFPFSGLGMK